MGRMLLSAGERTGPTSLGYGKERFHRLMIVDLSLCVPSGWR